METIQILANSTWAKNVIKVCWLFIADRKAIVYMTYYVISPSWTNCFLKWDSAVLSEFIKDMPMEDTKGLCNSPVFNKTEFLPYAPLHK